MNLSLVVASPVDFLRDIHGSWRLHQRYMGVLPFGVHSQQIIRARVEFPWGSVSILRILKRTSHKYQLYQRLSPKQWLQFRKLGQQSGRP